MEKHRKIAGILQYVLGAIILLFAILVFTGFFAGRQFAGNQQIALIFASVGTATGLFLIALALAFFIAGFGFMNGKTWGRLFMWVMAVLGLGVMVPIGTVIELYTIWALVKTRRPAGAF